jgi:outer membrane protein assembly factor BamB
MRAVNVFPVFVAGGLSLLAMLCPVARPHHCGVGHVQERDARPALSWPMFGGSPSRNMVGAEDQKIPDDWCVAEGKHKIVKWIAELGSQSIGSPIVANGKVFVVTNNARPRDPKVQGNRAVLMAFRESDGEFLWQIAHDYPDRWPPAGEASSLMSTPAVNAGSLYYVTAAGEVIRADADHGRIQWRYDMRKELNVHPYHAWCPLVVVSSWSSPLVVGEYVFTATGNGTDQDGVLVAPKAPSIIALDKRTGKLVWQSSVGSENTIEAQCSSPAFADHGGRPQVIYAGGDGVIYSFVPETGALRWKCHCLPTRKQRDDRDTDNQFVGTPVVVGDTLYVGMGIGDGLRGTRWSYFLSLDTTRAGDVSLRNYDAKSAENKGSALVWAFGGPVQPRPKRGPRSHFGRTISTAAVHDGLVYITEAAGYLHYLDAATGSRAWVYDLRSSVIGSPYLVNNRVYVGTEDGEVLIFGHQRAARLLATIDMGEDAILTTPTAVGGTLYIATRSKLYAIGSR